jgi:DNA-binding NtrC family response regulator
MSMSEPRRSILIVDDDRTVVEFLSESLAERGFDPTGATSGQEALEHIRRHPVDLVLTDVEMPGMRGTDLCAAILAEHPTQLIILITAFGTIELAVSAVRAGAADFVAKPFKIEALVFAIDRAFRDRQMRREIVRLKGAVTGLDSGGLVARSPAMRRTLDLARRAARVDSPVLLTGETGAGKGAIARFIHDASSRRSAPFFQVNCASVPQTLFESELFGARRGAYTDSREDRVGAFVAARDGTLFLDEIGEIAPENQAKLLHVLESGLVRPLGGTVDVAVKARVIAATNRPLEALLREGRFRPDLYYRLNVIRIETPPLRERRDDIVALVDLFVSRTTERHARPVIGVSAAAMRKLLSYAWPGNVRELANLLERAVALSDHDTLLPEDLDLPSTVAFEAPAPAPEADLSLAAVERAHVDRVLSASGGNKAAAARALGIDRRTLYRHLHDREPPNGDVE